MIHMRPFTLFERQNLKFLINHNVKFTQVEITPTGLAKSILDATAPMRAYFLENGIHDYENQKQGTEHKAFRQAVILTDVGELKTKASFYRPNTKKGDPRMWIYRLAEYSRGNDIHVLFSYGSTLYSINITRVDIEKCFNSTLITPLKEVMTTLFVESRGVADELLGRFRSVSGQWFEAEVNADTGIGRTIESFLGIKMNSDTTPDYKGIELKSKRLKSKNLKNVLFTQTPDWTISHLKSGKDIVNKYGYFTAEGKKTYQNTVQCSIPNAQHLLLDLNLEKETLELQAAMKRKEDIATWRLMKLHQRLLTKHHETFWIEVESREDNGKEYFRYKQIEHTRNPNVGQFDILLEQCLITVDLLLCRPSGHGDTYSFKIKRKGMPLLFPESIFYDI